MAALEDLTARLTAGQPVEVAWLTNQGTIIRRGGTTREHHRDVTVPALDAHRPTPGVLL